MKYCPNPDCPHYLEIGKPAEFLDEIDLCSDCGTRLQWGDEREPILTQPEPEAVVPWEEVAVFSNDYQAKFAKGRLEAEGIEAVFLDEHNALLDFCCHWSDGGIKLAVRQEDAAAAREILNADYSQAVPEGELGPEPGDEGK